VDFAGLCGEENLARLYADVYSLYSSEAKATPRSVEHDCAARVDHVCLEEYLINNAVVVHDVEFRGRKVKPPIAEILVHNINGMVLECGIEAGTFEDFAENSDGVDEVGEGREGSEAR
jgi:hypothetical protein